MSRAKKAALKWQFVATKENDKPRIVRLTFVYKYADPGEPLRNQPEFTTVFKPPYRLEVLSQPFVIK